MRKRTITFPSQRGILLVGHSEDVDGRCVGIYGDPEGLRSLGELLIAEAALDQEQFPTLHLPDHESHHLHLRPGIDIHPQSLPVVVGRLDSKQTGELPENVRPRRLKRERPIVEEFSTNV